MCLTEVRPPPEPHPAPPDPPAPWQTGSTASGKQPNHPTKAAVWWSCGTRGKGSAGWLQPDVNVTPRDLGPSRGGGGGARALDADVTHLN